MGNPHAVVYVEDVKGLDIETIGPAFENHERFPNRVNTEFVKVLDRNTVEMRVVGTWIGRDDGLRNGSVCSRSRMYSKWIYRKIK